MKKHMSFLVEYFEFQQWLLETNERKFKKMWRKNININKEILLILCDYEILKYGSFLPTQDYLNIYSKDIRIKDITIELQKYYAKYRVLNKLVQFQKLKELDILSSLDYKVKKREIHFWWIECSMLILGTLIGFLISKI